MCAAWETSHIGVSCGTWRSNHRICPQIRPLLQVRVLLHLFFVFIALLIFVFIIYSLNVLFYLFHNFVFVSVFEFFVCYLVFTHTHTLTHTLYLSLTPRSFTPVPLYLRCLYPRPSVLEGCRSCANAGVLGPVPGLIGTYFSVFQYLRYSPL